MTNTYIAAVRNKETGDVSYLKSHNGVFRGWTDSINQALHFESKSNADRALSATYDGLYEKKVGTYSQVVYWANQGPAKYIMVAQSKTHPDRFYYKIGAGWVGNIEDAKLFISHENAKKAAERTKDERYLKFVGTRSQVESWVKMRSAIEASKIDMKKLQDQVNASVKKVADCTLTPPIFISQDQARSMILGQDFDIKFDEVETPEADHTSGSNDLTSLDVIETYIEKAQKIEEEGADEYTWRGFLHAFLGDIQKAAR